MTRFFRTRDEQGIALITAIMVGFIATMFTLTMMFTAFHGQTSSAHNRSWGQALHVAELALREEVLDRERVGQEVQRAEPHAIGRNADLAQVGKLAQMRYFPMAEAKLP